MAFRTILVMLMLCTLVAGTGSMVVAAQDRNQAITGKVAAKHVETFDDLDFNVFSNQKWDELSKSHSQDVLVHWPDGHTTKGIKRHIEYLKAMFTYAPDTKISAHPVKIAVGDWTAVIGVMEGTFTKPMVMGDKTIPPTGKHFSMQMTTLGHWTKAGVMDEEYLFWDNATYMKQLGVSQ
jgi:hypothetical protein